MPSTGVRGWDPQVMMRLITPERMSTYLDACSGDIDGAFTLYRRNIDIASSIQAITAMVEVVLRNAIDRALTGYVAHIGQVDDWFDLSVLDAKAQDDIRIARQRVRRSGNRVDHSHLEPVFRRDLAADFRRACLLMEWIDPNARAWLEENIQMTK